MMLLLHDVEDVQVVVMPVKTGIQGHRVLSVALDPAFRRG
jgi:hypothetical protein